MLRASSDQYEDINVVGLSQTAVPFLSHHPFQFHQVLHVRQESLIDFPALFVSCPPNGSCASAINSQI